MILNHMLLIIIWYFFIIIFGLGLASTSRNWPQPRPHSSGLDLGLEVLASFNITVTPYDLIQGQGHRGLKCMKMANFKAYLFCQYARNQKTNGEL